jgi:hypothetical protein
MNIHGFTQTGVQAQWCPVISLWQQHKAERHRKPTDFNAKIGSQYFCLINIST